MFSKKTKDDLLAHKDMGKHAGTVAEKFARKHGFGMFAKEIGAGVKGIVEKKQMLTAEAKHRMDGGSAAEGNATAAATPAAPGATTPGTEAVQQPHTDAATASAATAATSPPPQPQAVASGSPPQQQYGAYPPPPADPTRAAADQQQQPQQPQYAYPPQQYAYPPYAQQQYGAYPPPPHQQYAGYAPPPQQYGAYAPPPQQWTPPAAAATEEIRYEAVPIPAAHGAAPLEPYKAPVIQVQAVAEEQKPAAPATVA